LQAKLDREEAERAEERKRMEALSAQLMRLEEAYNSERDNRQAAMNELQDELKMRRENEVLLTQRLAWQDKLHEQQLAMLKDMRYSNLSCCITIQRY
jgi:pantothenate synthetase